MECKKCGNEKFIVRKTTHILAEPDEIEKNVLSCYRVVKTGEDMVSCEDCGKEVPFWKIKKFKYEFGY